VLFQREVDCGSAPRRVVLHIAAESFAKVWVNGVEAHRTTSISYPGHHLYETVDVTARFGAGANRVAVLVRYLGIGSGNSCPQDPGLLCEFEIEEPDGTLHAVGSGADWRCHRLDAWRGQTRRSHWFNLDLIEDCDLRRLPAGWPHPAEPGEAPEAIREPGVRYVLLEPRAFPNLQYRDVAGALTILRQGRAEDRSAVQPIAALAVSEEVIRDAAVVEGDASAFTVAPTPTGEVATVVLSLGGYRRGYLRLAVEGCPDAVVDLAWHELLVDGRIDVRVPRCYTADRFVLTGRAETVESEDWICGRYVQLSFRNVRQSLRVGLRWIEAEYPLRPQVAFDSSDQRLSRIVALGVNAARLCMQDNIMDCPWRERRQWIGDVQRIALVNHHVFGDRALVRAVLRQHARFQDPETGRMWVCLPLYEEYPEQSMEWLRAVLEYEHYTGDRTLLDEVGGAVERLHAWFLRQTGPDGLFRLNTPPMMLWMDNPYAPLRRHAGHTSFLAQNLRYLLFLDDVATAMSRLGRGPTILQARARRRAVERRVAAAFLDAETGLLRDLSSPEMPASYSEMGHALAVLAGLPDIDEVRLWERFEAWCENGNSFIAPSPFGKYHTLEALGQLGQPSRIVEEILRCWGPMVDAGSDTAWEHFDGRGSQCHGWAGTPVVALLRHVLRYDPRKPRLRMTNRIDGIDWLRAQPCAVNPSETDASPCRTGSRASGSSARAGGAGPRRGGGTGRSTGNPRG